MFDLEPYKPKIASLCREYNVLRLDAFGSVTRPSFHPDNDIDILALFDRKLGNIHDRYFDLKESLEELFHRPVDLVLADSIRNPYFQKAVDQSKISLYIMDN